MISCIVKFLQSRVLKNIPFSVRRAFIPISNATKVGFIFDGNEENSYDCVKYLESVLKENKVTYKGICLDIIDHKDGEIKHQNDPYVTYLYKKEISKIGVPDEDIIRKFISEQYDILFDLTFNDSFTLRYLIKSAKTPFIIGFDSRRKEYHDMTFSSPEEKNKDLVEHIKTATKFLTTIKSENNNE